MAEVQPEVKRNPRDSMKSTWRSDKSQWTVHHYLYELLNLHNSTMGVKPPVHEKTDKVPFLSNWQQQRWVLFHASIPLVLHHAYVVYTGHNLGPLGAWLLYMLALKLIGIRQLHALRAVGEKYGFLDGDKHERDGVPDHSVFRVLLSLVMTSTIRPIMAVMLAYRTNKPPSSINLLWLPLELGCYGIILDFWFYWYHRLMHQVPQLWRFHRTHHLTKHPSPLLTLYADSEQEFFDIVGIPLMTFATMRLMGFPMGFYEWWMCQQFVIWTELTGHSGLRVYSTPPSTLYWLLAALKADLITEDHDLHHRTGWKKSHNYGKQTRLWDKIFGTTTDRIECSLENVDFDNRVTLPLF